MTRHYLKSLMVRLPSSRVPRSFRTTNSAGGAQGIGASAVEIFVDAGAKVVFADLNTEGGRSTEKKVQG
jgi:hypothetical protein